VIYQAGETSLGCPRYPFIAVSFSGVQGAERGVHARGLGERDDGFAACAGLFLLPEFPPACRVLADFVLAPGLHAVGCEGSAVSHLIGAGVFRQQHGFSFSCASANQAKNFLGTEDKTPHHGASKKLKSADSHSPREQTILLSFEGSGSFFAGGRRPIGRASNDCSTDRICVPPFRIAIMDRNIFGSFRFVPSHVSTN